MNHPQNHYPLCLLHLRLPQLSPRFSKLLVHPVELAIHAKGSYWNWKLIPTRIIKRWYYLSFQRHPKSVSLTQLKERAILKSEVDIMEEEENNYPCFFPDNFKPHFPNLLFDFVELTLWARRCYQNYKLILTISKENSMFWMFTFIKMSHHSSAF